MQRIARRGDPRLGQQHLVVANAEIGNRPAQGHRPPQFGGRDPDGGHWKLRDRPHPRDMEANSGHCANDALAADRGGLDRLAVPHHDDHGDHPGEREIDLIDFIAGFGKNRASGELHGDEMWQQPLQFLVRERRHQFVAERSRIDGIHGQIRPVGLGLVLRGLTWRPRTAAAASQADDASAYHQCCVPDINSEAIGMRPSPAKPPRVGRMSPAPVLSSSRAGG